MAWSRLEKIGTIFSRVNGLLRAGALKEEDKPLWYELYKRFPPLEEPKFDRPAPDIPVRKIFYSEDIIRAKFHKVYGTSYRMKLDDNANPTQCQQFIKMYNNLKEKGDIPEDEIFQKVADMIGLSAIQTRNARGENEVGQSSLASSFRKAKERHDKDVPRSAELNIKDIFKE